MVDVEKDPVRVKSNGFMGPERGGKRSDRCE